MKTPKRHEDRRIQRTRQALVQAFMDVVREKNKAGRNIRDIEKCFAATSIQEIAERANVNRGTFYLHFTDKYMLVDTVVRESFHQQLTAVLPAEPRWDKATLRSLVQTILEIFEQKYQHQQQPSLFLLPIFERAMHEELSELFLKWLKKAENKASLRSESPEMIARVISWAIFGPAMEWSREETAVSLEQMTDSIVRIVMEGVAQRTLPE